MRRGLCLLALAACSPERPTGAPLSPSASSSASTSSPSLAPSAAPAAPSSASSSARRPERPDVNDPSQHDVLRKIAASYPSFFRADGVWWAPYDCLAPPDDTPRMSSAPDGFAHGRKLYTLQIADYAAYAKETASDTVPKGGRREPVVQKIEGASQVVVKVSYEPLTTKPETRVAFGVGSVTDNGTTYWPGPQRDLFVMYKPTAAGVDTDAGWLYGTVSPDGKTITSAGKVESCMRCHTRARHGRLFGVR